MKEFLVWLIFIIVFIAIIFLWGCIIYLDYFKPRSETTYAVTVYIGNEIIPYYTKDSNVENGELKYVDEDGLTWCNFQYKYRKLESEVEK